MIESYGLCLCVLLSVTGLIGIAVTLWHRERMTRLHYRLSLAAERASRRIEAARPKIKDHVRIDPEASPPEDRNGWNTPPDLDI